MIRCFKNLEQCAFHPIDEQSNRAFVLMPFAPEYNRIYHDGIKASLEDFGLTCEHSDEKWDTPEIVCTICKSIQEASVIVADVTGKNPNVFLELWLSFGLEKNILLMTQDLNDLPFDLRTFRVIHYNPRDLDQLKATLQTSLEKLSFPHMRTDDAVVFTQKVHTYRQDLHPYGNPMIQIFIGSTNVSEPWLPPNKENEDLLSCAPRFLQTNVLARLNFYDFESRNDMHFLRVYPDGFLHAYCLCHIYEDKTMHTISFTLTT